jgi:hypothetical protein
VQTQLLVPEAGSVHNKSQDAQAKYTNVTFSSVTGAPKKGYHLKTTADPRQAIQQMTAGKDKLAGMQEEKRKAVEEGEKWAKASAKLEGVKVRDDEARLKKAAKRKEKEKAKSKKTWFVVSAIILSDDNLTEAGMRGRSRLRRRWLHGRKSGQIILR